MIRLVGRKAKTPRKEDEVSAKFFKDLPSKMLLAVLTIMVSFERSWMEYSLKQNRRRSPETDYANASAELANARKKGDWGHWGSVEELESRNICICYRKEQKKN